MEGVFGNEGALPLFDSACVRCAFGYVPHHAARAIMSPTWLEVAVAILLLWVAWRLALLLTPWVLKRFRDSRNAPRRSELTNRKD